MSQSDQAQVKVFIQGSADIAGSQIFRSNLNTNFNYQTITYMPEKSGMDKFESTPATRTISATNFDNNDLPFLRGKYLKEMIRVYSKKLDPILLEGSVKSEVNKKDRNAVMYLYIPKTLVSSYGR